MYKLNLKIYWTDYLASLLIFAVSFYFVATTGSVVAFVLAIIFLYRAGAFTHEIAHQNKNPKMKVFKFVWNITMGLLILQPSLRFTNTHLKHHTTGIFATENDPQYPLIFKDIKLAAAIFLLLPWVLPIYNLLVCLIYKNKSLESILYKDIKYTKTERRIVDSYELYYAIATALVLALVPLQVIVAFYLVSVGAWYLSVLRIPLEHPLSEYKKTSTSRDQEVLSYTHESPLYIPIQPLALRYHTVHHMYPKIPYHNLKKEHSRLRDEITLN